MAVRILHNDYPHRSVALVSPSYTLVFHHSSGNTKTSESKCAVEFSATENVDLADYNVLSNQPCLGCLGIINIGRDTFLCTISLSREVAQVRPGEMVYRILGIEFHCLNRSDYDNFLENEINPYPVESDGWDQGRSQQPIGVEHPCLALKKLLSDGTFYYSGDFDLTSRLQDRSISLDDFDIGSFDPGFMWNSHMIGSLLQFRSHLGDEEKGRLDHAGFLTCVIRGFVESLTIQRPTTRMEGRSRATGLPARLTLISRLSCRRAGTRFNARGIDDDGNVANFVETETVIWNPSSGHPARAVAFSYCQIRGSIPIFWEQQTGILPNQQKIQITRSPEATQPAFDKHIEGVILKYGSAHIVDLLSETKSGEIELSTRYRLHTQHVCGRGNDKTIRDLLRSTEYDFHAQTKGPAGYEAASQIRRIVEDSSDAFGYFLMEGASEGEDDPKGSFVVVLQQEGVFRTNCLDCLDRTNLVQGILSKSAVEAFLQQRAEVVGHDFWMQHSTLWADNGDALSKIYAGTGALKSSFTRTGKMSLAGAFADARKSATRVYINNFADKDRQNTIDVLLGRLVGQEPVSLYDPANDYVTAELNKRSSEFTTELPVHIYAGTFNLNGKTTGIDHDLTEWLRPPFLSDVEKKPELVVVGFQEIVELSPQQIMATDPARRKLWETALLKCLNRDNDDPYILLRGGQLVGAALLIFVRSSVIGEIKNVEGSLKKTGLSGNAGNKGAVAIRMEYASTRLCFVTAHLAAGFSNYDERNKDYATIANGLRFQRGRKIEDHDAVIWLGDFNYRIGLPDEKVRKLVEIGDLQTLYDNDQLQNAMVAGLTFPYYTESRINFDPTYKYDIGSDDYDTSEKRRIPAWCDRILWKGKGLEQLTYGCASTIRFSDHRPVFATFKCTVSVVNDIVQTQRSRELYLKYQAGKKSGGVEVEDSLLDDEEDDLLDFQPLAPGLPPPSSEKQKWWLNNGLPAKSTVAPPQGTVPNPHRPPNPFTETAEPDWVKIDSASIKKPVAPLPPPTRKLPPPYDPSALPTLGGGGTGRHTSNSSVSSSSAGKSSKPPIPQKPSVLRRKSFEGKNHSFDGGAGGIGERDIYPPPPPRRVMTIGMEPPPSVKRKPLPPPGLPPRPSVDLMGGEEPMIGGWEPLKPS